VAALAGGMSWLGPQPAVLAADPYLAVAGPNLTYNGQVVNLRGENFNNETALSCCGSGNIADINASVADYQQVGSMGGNLVRFGLNYQWYSNNPTKFYSVMDQHLAMAAAAHLWVIPVMFGPPGGSSGGYSGQDGFWGSPANQQALIAFWADFAHHYASNSTLAGFDIFNEPAPPSAGAWTNWAQKATQAITAADANHFVVLEVDSADWNLPAVSGGRVLWSSHCYAAIGSDGCNYPGADPHNPPARPYFVGEVGSTYPSMGSAPANLRTLNGQGVSWAGFVMHDQSFGLYRNYAAGDFSSPWSAMIQAVTSSMSGAARPNGPAPTLPRPSTAP